MRKFLTLTASKGKRCIASYDSVPLTATTLSNKVQKQQTKSSGNLLELLQKTEDNIFRWKLNRWELRVPPLLPPHEKEAFLLKLNLLKNQFIHSKSKRDQVNNDLNIIKSITGLKEEEIYGKNRQWLQETAANLRWKGEVNNAKMLRDAFLRLESIGSADRDLLERLCCIYGLGLLGTFEDAFSNVIEENPLTKELSVNEENNFTTLLSTIITSFPDINIIYDFLGFNVQGGYRDSLAKVMKEILVQKSGGIASESQGRVLFYNPSNMEVLFDFGNSKQTISNDDSVYGLPDFFLLRNTDIYMITIASDNHWFRSRQVPHSKQVEGIMRRSCFTFGLNYDDVRVKKILLPPGYMDKASIVRVCEALGVSFEKASEILPWLKAYRKELDSIDVDYCEMEKVVNNEEWLKL